MYQRTVHAELVELAAKYPVVTVMGPRQSGKTTLVRGYFQDKPYFNLELPSQRALVMEDPYGFLSQFDHGVVLDEIQRLPELLSYIQVIADEKKQKGMFILTGSHQVSLHEAISQSLAGRTALLTLLPMTLNELNQAGFDYSVDKQILYGGFPRVYKDNLNPTKTYADYFRTYVERDVRQMLNVKDINLFEKFIKLCAGRIGGVFEASSLANEVGVSNKTISHWLSILEASYIVFRLPPYFENIGKRLIKSPKLYFTDVGLASYLLGIESEAQLSRDPLRGDLFENLVVLELMKYRFNRAQDPNLYFYRDQSKNEIDIIIKHGHELIPVEIKSAQTFHSQFLKGLKLLKRILPERVPQGYVLYAGDSRQRIGDFELLNYRNSRKVWEQLD